MSADTLPHIHYSVCLLCVFNGVSLLQGLRPVGGPGFKQLHQVGSAKVKALHVNDGSCPTALSER